MKKTLIIFGYVAVIVAAYFFGSLSVKKVPSSEPTQTENATTRAVTDTAKLYGKIVKLDSKNAELRLVEWVQGSDNQEQTAFETGRCTLERIEKDECLPNPFFIRETQKTLTLPMTPDIKIQVLSPGPSGEIKQDEQLNTVHREINLADLAKMLENHDFAEQIPFIFTTKDGSIIKIEEQYIP
ncbi:MAG: hypothetical protein HYT15_01575 [Candidatus Magasanikbacteria bacterium]|nr:hypothetical protein [Candidatus Magasanikbacteria bacterium]